MSTDFPGQRAALDDAIRAAKARFAAAQRLRAEGRGFWDFPPQYSDCTALIDAASGRHYSFAELGDLAEQWRVRIAAANPDPVPPFVALEFDSSVDSIAAYLGALRAHAPVLLVAPGQLAPESPLHQHYAPDVGIVRVDGELVTQLGDHRDMDLPAAHPELAILLSTSGTTGDPKLVRLSRRNIHLNACAIAGYLGIRGDDRAITTLPLFYSYGLSVLNSYLLTGAALVLCHHSVTEAEFWQIFTTHGATSLALVPHQFDLLERTDFAGRVLPSLRYVTQAGGKLAPEVAQRFITLGQERGWQFFIMYGQTEAAPRISWVPPVALPNAADSIGIAVPGGRLWLVDESGAEIAAAGVAGELVYGGPNVMMGYARGRQDFARGAETPELHTGDIAERTPEGFFRVTGRLKRFVKLFGLRISLDQVELLLRGQQMVAHAVAVGDRLVVLLDDPARLAEARDIIATTYELPTDAILSGHLANPPLLPSGKVDHHALGAIGADIVAESLDMAARKTDIAALLRTATRALDAIHPDDSFTSLGGDSLSYLNVQMGLERLLGHVPPDWENMSLAQLEALRPDKRRLVRVDTDILLRVAAITLIIAEHASHLPLYGGTWILILLMGYSAARFQTRSIVDGRAGRVFAKMLYPILPFYFIIILAYSAYAFGTGDHAPEASYFLLCYNYAETVSNTILTPYWFISLYVQLVLLLALAATQPWLRRQLAEFRWRTTLALLALVTALYGLLLLHYGPVQRAALTDYPLHYRTMRGLVECLPIFMLGWGLQMARSRRETGIVLLFALGVVVMFSQVLVYRSSPPMLLALVVVLLAGVKSLPLPAMLTRPAQMIAAATLFIYLLHPVVVHVLRYATSFSAIHGQLATVVAAVLLSVAVGYLAKILFDWLDRLLLQRLRQNSATMATVADRPH